MAEDPNKKDPENKDPENGQQTPPAGSPDDSLPKTQEDLDALIQKRLEREKKKWAKIPAQPPAQQPPASAPAQPNPAQPPAEDGGAQFAAQRELAEARAQLAAYKEGVSPDAVEDAVYLAVREVEKAGDDPGDADAIADALKAVIKRHPEWKKEAEKPNGQKGGFRVGAAGSTKQQFDDDALASVFGNKT